MVTAEFNGVKVAESDETVVVEGNHYFPASSVSWDYFTKTDNTSVCGWKGTASYYSIEADGQSAENVAWQYEEPLKDATHITGYVAFYPKVSVTES